MKSQNEPAWKAASKGFDTVVPEADLPPLPPNDGTLASALRQLERENDSRNPKEAIGCANHFPRPTPLSALQPTPGRGEWFWFGYLGPGAITVLTGLWKAGKTVLLSHLLAGLNLEGEFCGLKKTPAKVVLLSEESSDIWIERRDRLGIGDHVHLLQRPFRQRPLPGEWLALVDHICQCVAEEGYHLVVLDPLPNFWPVRDENDAGQVIDALNPLRRLTDRGVGVLLLMHPRKSDGAEATATRGSGAIAAFPDVLLELRRMNPADRKDRRRVITANSRYRETPAELVIELSADERTYVALGDRAEASQTQRFEQIKELLPGDPPGLTVLEILAAWPSEDKPGQRTLEMTLARGCEQDEWQSGGAGKKGDPRRYWLSPVVTPFD